jgi:hypothetical protein
MKSFSLKKKTELNELYLQRAHDNLNKQNIRTTPVNDSGKQMQSKIDNFET